MNDTLEKLIDYRNDADQYIRETAEEYYSNESNSIEDRIQMFSMFGRVRNYQGYFNNNLLQEIFEHLYHECDYFSRYETVHVECIIDSWIDLIYDYKYKLGEDRYGDISIIKYNDRDYTPSMEAEERYRNILYKLFFKEKVSSFVID